MKLDIGCGGEPRHGYTGVDIRPLPGVGIVCAAWDIERVVGAATVEAIYSRHMLEHLTYAQGRRALFAWAAVLVPGGLLEVIVPDLAYHCRQFLTEPHAVSAYHPRVTNREHALGSLFGWQRNEFDAHQSGYDEAMLRALLEDAGFVQVLRQATEPWHLALSARKGS
jgi:predicted SAM-dependent methyltransferase